MGLFEFLGPQITPHPKKPHAPQVERGPWYRETPTVMPIPPHVEGIDPAEKPWNQKPPTEIRL